MEIVGQTLIPNPDRQSLGMFEFFMKIILDYELWGTFKIILHQLHQPNYLTFIHGQWTTVNGQTTP